MGIRSSGDYPPDHGAGTSGEERWARSVGAGQALLSPNVIPSRRSSESETVVSKGRSASIPTESPGGSLLWPDGQWGWSKDPSVRHPHFVRASARDDGCCFGHGGEHKPDERIGFRAVEIAWDLANARAVRSYAKAGFRTVKTFYVTGEEPGNTGRRARDAADARGVHGARYRGPLSRCGFGVVTRELSCACHERGARDGEQSRAGLGASRQPSDKHGISHAGHRIGLRSRHVASPTEADMAQQTSTTSSTDIIRA